MGHLPPPPRLGARNPRAWGKMHKGHMSRRCNAPHRSGAQHSSWLGSIPKRLTLQLICPRMHAIYGGSSCTHWPLEARTTHGLSVYPSIRTALRSGFLCPGWVDLVRVQHQFTRISQSLADLGRGRAGLGPLCGDC